jgi:hypothetical protein
MKNDKIKWYTDLREGLRKYGIPIDEISKLVKLVNNIRHYDYDVEKVINEFSDLERKATTQKSSRCYTVFGKYK